VELVQHDVTSGDEVREQMERELGRVATPAIVIGRRVFWGFEENKQDIADLLGIDLTRETSPSQGGGGGTGRREPASPASGNGRGEVR
jgi:hypothetical protein